MKRVKGEEVRASHCEWELRGGEWIWIEKLKRGAGEIVAGGDGWDAERARSEKKRIKVR